MQTTTTIVKRCILMTTDPGDLVLDPTCGSGTTAYVAEQWGRRWITCDTSRVALALARTRLMAAKYPYYLLADSTEGIKKETELTGKRPPEYQTENDIRKGFVYKRVPHVTLKSIANNPDIREVMTRKQIDAAIARHADTETQYDHPYEDNKRVRVCGPFSVESLSPHRVNCDQLPVAIEQGAEVSEQKKGQSRQTTDNYSEFVSMILDNIKKAGVQNTKKSERLTFDTLDVFPGQWIHAAGTYTEKVAGDQLQAVSEQGAGEGGRKTGHYSLATDHSQPATVRRVAVSIGPENGTVGPQQVKEAAKEAVQGVGFDMLVVCGFAFDPHVAEEVKRYGKLTVLPTRMNPDLYMGDKKKKKTGAGNLFMVFGEPDVEIQSIQSVNNQSVNQIVIEIKGVDVYDPTTGQIRSASTDDIACWFIDTDYNGESFFVRHAYFTGADEPYDKLKRALRADIDEAAWRSLYRTISRPFDKPGTGKIAVKVINHYGDEVLKVFEM
ncbi:MAG: DNA methyltransferase [Deltaproteobacteria bacterium]|nr:DNA methyltransferase [Deltaproteobacteria bacterium]